MATKTKALAKAAPQQLTTSDVKQTFETALAGLATVMSGQLAPAHYPALLRDIKAWSAALEAMDGMARRTIEEMVLSDGEHVPETKGTVELVKDGVRFRVQRTRTGIDPKKLESKLRAIGLDPIHWMDVKITHTVNGEKLKVLLLNEYITADELPALEYDVSYSVKQPEVM